MRRGVAADGGVQQQLEGEPGSTRALGRQGRHRGQVAAGAVAGHGDAARVDAERLRVLRDPLHGGNRVLDRGRERVLCRPETRVDVSARRQPRLLYLIFKISALPYVTTGNMCCMTAIPDAARRKSMCRGAA